MRQTNRQMTLSSLKALYYIVQG